MNLDPELNFALVCLMLQIEIDDAASDAHRLIAASFRQARIDSADRFAKAKLQVSVDLMLADPDRTAEQTLYRFAELRARHNTETAFDRIAEDLRGALRGVN